MARLRAGTYFLFYTLFGSMPLLMSILTFWCFCSTTCIPTIILFHTLADDVPFTILVVW